MPKRDFIFILQFKGADCVQCKFWQSGVPLQDLSSRRSTNLEYLSQIVGKARNWWFKVEIFDLKANMGLCKFFLSVKIATSLLALLAVGYQFFSWKCQAIKLVATCMPPEFLSLCSFAINLICLLWGNLGHFCCLSSLPQIPRYLYFIYFESPWPSEPVLTGHEAQL